jgi:hypothetical protein
VRGHRQTVSRPTFSGVEANRPAASRAVLAGSLCPIGAVVLPACAFALVLLAGPLGGIGLAVRFGTVPLYLLWLLLIRPFGASRLVSGCAATMLFALPLLGVWKYRVSTEWSLIGGIIPFGNAGIYFADATRVLEGLPMGAESGQRPLFSVLLALLLWLGGHSIPLAVAALTLLVAASCVYLARSVQETHGAMAASFVLVLLFAFHRGFAGMTQTEPLGLALGALGLSEIWRGATEQRHRRLVAGMCLLTLGLCARAGAFLVLPALVVWAGWGRRAPQPGAGMRFFGASVAGVAVGALLNLAAYRSVAPPEAVPFSNYGYSLYGLASGGKGWQQFERDHPSVAGRYDASTSRQAFRAALALVKERPQALVLGMAALLARYVEPTSSGAFGFLQPLPQGQCLSAPGSLARADRLLCHTSRLALLLASILGLWRGLRHRRDAHASLALYASLGVLLSAPLLPDDTSRVFAATLPVTALLPMIGLFGVRERPTPSCEIMAARKTPVARVGLWFRASIAAAFFAVPATMLATRSSHQVVRGATGMPSDAVIVRLHAGAILAVGRPAAARRWWTTPLTTDRDAFLAGLQLGDPQLARILASTPVESRIVTAVDLSGRRSRFFLLVLDPSNVPALPAVVEASGDWVEGILMARRVRPA